MATLTPKNSTPCLSVETVVERATVEFRCVITDQPRAMKRLAERLAAETPGIEHHAAEQQLQAVAESVEMICTDDPHSDEQFLVCFVVPGRPIEILNQYDGHEKTAATLVQRLARVLDYSIVE